MARIRSIKPDFFRHEGLYESEQKYNLPLRVAFSGLWTAADREGRFKWLPKTLKLDCLPYDNVDFAAVMDALWHDGFIMKYKIDNEEYGYIPSWKDHQVVNNREKPSELPEPQGGHIIHVHGKKTTRKARVRDASTTSEGNFQVEGEGKGRGKEGEDEAHDEIVYPFQSPEFLRMWELWKQYKLEEFKFKYKSKISEQAALQELAEFSEGDELTALKIIKKSMAKKWQGLFELKDGKQASKKGQTESGGDYDTLFESMFGNGDSSG